MASAEVEADATAAATAVDRAAGPKAEFVRSPAAQAMQERLTGKKLVQGQPHLAGQYVEAQYRVDEFIAFFPGRGSEGGSLVQFMGLRATRAYDVTEEPPAWNVEPEPRKHTVEMTTRTKVVKTKRREGRKDG